MQMLNGTSIPMVALGEEPGFSWSSLAHRIFATAMMGSTACYGKTLSSRVNKKIADKCMLTDPHKIWYT